jgi:AraC-like DNA-binding protein
MKTAINGARKRSGIRDIAPYTGRRTVSIQLVINGIHQFYIRRAGRYTIDHADLPITVSQVAAEIGVSLRSLQADFRRWRSTLHNLFLRQTRLQLARRMAKRT